ncbi:MAG: hypothetical protein IJY25_06630 [Bacilli bacterium]|nr:hypothetical protein [Bacilli bacterium]
MKFYVETFNSNQLYKENEYINNTYFFDFLRIERTEKRENNYLKSDVILNFIPYTMYEIKGLGFNTLLIPKNFESFDKDFDNIVVYSGSKFGLHFSTIKRENNQLKLMAYDFVTNDLSYSTANYRHNCFDDNDKKLQKIFSEQKKDVVTFLINENYSQLFNYSFNRIKRNTNETKINRVYGDSLFEAYQTFEKNFEIIDDNESPLMKILTDLDLKKVK